MSLHDLDEKVNRRTKALETGFIEYIKSRMPQILEDYWSICDEHALMIYEEHDRDEFLNNVNENVKKVLGKK